MEAGVRAFSFLTQEQFIIVPYFQRPYVWEKKNWEKLFNDLVNDFPNKPHFLGSLVFKQLNTVSGSHRNLIDGQQRLTTFFILVKVLYDDIEKDLDETDKQNYKSYIYNDFSKKITKLIHSKADKKSFDDIFKDDYKEEYSSSKEKIHQCYVYLKSRVQNLEIDKIRFFKFITTSKFFVVVSLGINDDEQQIFDSINQTGKALGASDIIKNILFYKLLKSCDGIEKNQDDIAQIYNEKWFEIFESDKDNGNGEKIKDFWISEVKSYSKNVNILYYLAISKGFFSLKDKHKRDDLGFVYKKYIEYKNFYEVEKLLDEIKLYANVYQNLAWAKPSENYKFSEFEKRLMHIISITDYESLVPLILQLKLCNLNEDELKKCFKEIEKLAVRNWIARNHTKSFGNIVAENIKEVRGYDTLKEILPKFGKIATKQIIATLSGKDLEGNFKNLENNRATLVLFWIELSKRTAKHDMQGLQYNYSLEHIMPQSTTKNINENWSSVCNDTDKAKELVYQIGNMMLVTQSLNSALSNKKWSEKREELKKFSSLITSEKVLDKDDWDEKAITDRTKDLIKDFFKIWGNDGELE
ncbi:MULTISPECIES: DUF262 domain-containing protein [unclassified Campylobacter]|uniref:DUF262 domain-containing protein n=1 Tax=unclassified Campylobacter TaxID=2593542 RepID=UPI0022E9F593|nr:MULTISPECIES: DUF262 domain-containing HNH endonuclease family protein [unclassified Campylobacter]MDA3079814.1 DUF262 domain-containing HNH endonuclease family protein [Campylobacter sp. CS_NA2]MDA3081426.1 DUF262 domain-containing HNH endonuclease family protein [Campylobacter sp. CS_NA1]MDA3085915.1 DUF262 domain-containing HNH endonuclease family protein [Campylobacter sp. CS_ED1]MDA3090648.1 DUF262 domain-containing HNH endonuclease family protein [Campylobacter sp. CS_ED2]WBR50577.1 D